MADTTWIAIEDLHPGVTADAGNAFPNTTALTAATPDFDLEHWQYSQDVDGSLFGVVTLPKTIGATPNAKIILILFANATTGVTRFSVDARPYASDAESIDQALDTTISSQDITVPGTANNTKKVTFTLPTTGNGFPVAAEDQLFVRIFHEGAHANDTLAVDTKLLSAYLEVDLS